jgi:hypothetical protein
MGGGSVGVIVMERFNDGVFEWKVMRVNEEKGRKSHLYIPSRHHLSSPLSSHSLAV